MSSRREFLKQTSLLAGGAGLWSSLPASIKKAISINPELGTTFLDAEHVVILMQENRSFDHVFGTLQGVRGYNDPRAITIPGRIPVWAQPNERGERFAPFRLNMKDTRATWVGGLPHSWDNQVDARNNGKYDRWLDVKRKTIDSIELPFTLGYYTREDLPFYYALADSFTVCDQNFCASLTGTTANRSFHWTGTIREKPGAIACVRNSDTYYNKEAHWMTYPERLEENGISWKVYQNELSLTTDLNDNDESWLANFTDNNLEWFSNYNVRFHKATYDYVSRRINELPAEIDQLKKQLVGKKQNQAVPVKKELNNKESQLVSYQALVKRWNPENWERLSPFQKSIHEKAFVTNTGDPFYHQTDPLEYEHFGIKREIRVPKGDVLFQFRKDVDEGNLPTVSWLVAPQMFSDHPSAPWFGAWYVSEVLDILTKNPEVWKKTIFILNYDENDGYFDHIPPYVAPKQGDLNTGKTSSDIDTTQDYVTMEEEMRRKNLKPEDMRESPIGLGYRVPLVIASPWTRGGWVNSQLFDITSTLRFLETFLEGKTGKRIIETNITRWRRTIVGDLSSAFRPYNGEKIGLPDFLNRDKFIEEIYDAKFKENPSGYHQLTEENIVNFQKSITGHLLPGQEKGTRPSCAIPYQLHTDGALNDNKDVFKITFHPDNQFFGRNAPGSPFNVYAPGSYKVNGNFEEVKSWAFAVKSGDFVDYEWPLSDFEDEKYDLKVYGPNGFLRSFTGDKNDADLQMNAIYESDLKGTPTGNITISFKNGKDNCSVRIIDNCYGNGDNTFSLKPAEEKTVTFNLNKSYGWYDLTVLVNKKDNFSRQFAGRVETGRSSMSDPYMGRVV